MEKKEVKPIFIIGVPFETAQDGSPMLQKHLEETLTDYHILMTIHNNDDFTFQCFYPKDFDEIKHNELVKKIENQIKKLKTK